VKQVKPKYANQYSGTDRWLPFEEARKIVRIDVKKYGISGWNKWQNDYVKNNKIPDNIPRQPHRAYKNKGWVSWGDWLGTNVVYYGFIKWLPFDIARCIARKDAKKYDINSKNRWYSEYVNGGHRPNNIPSDPSYKYKNKGWISWGDWLGTNNKTGGQRQYKINEEFFKKWSHDMAYILGFWFADGNIKGGRIFSIYQHNKDKYLLCAILNRMRSNYPVYKDHRYPHCYINISSKIIYQDILKLGGRPAKSLTIDFPSVPRKYLFDFLRGNFDGDGSIYYDKANHKYFSCFTGGSKKFIVKMKKCFDKEKIISKIVIGHNSSRPFYYLRFNAYNTLKLGKILYRKDGLKMNRKFDLFQKAKETNI